MPYPELRPGRLSPAKFVLIALLLAAFLSARAIASLVIEYQWWKEIGQLPTWFEMIWYRVAPVAAAAWAFFAVLWIAHARGLKLAGERLGAHRVYAWVSTLALLVFAILMALALVDTWTVVRYFGGQDFGREAAAWRDPVFGQPLGFYIFDLPYYSLLLRLLLACALVGGVLFWLTARGWQLRARLPEWREGAQFDLADLRLSGALESRFLRTLGCAFLLTLAARFYFDRFALVFSDHNFLVGVDWVNEHVGLPLQWLLIAACLAAAVFVWLGRVKLAAAMATAIVLRMVVPGLVSAVYVRPNEISLQKPYIQRHIQATRKAFGLSARSREIEFAAKLEGRIDPARHKPLIDNVRLWDWRAFHDTVTQIQALRPYYVFADTDVDRYTIDGQLRQVLLTPRELDIRQLSEGRTRWPNTHLIYTHGFGLVLAEANRISPEGLPVLFVKDAPPVLQTPSLKLTRPEIYYGEVAHEPVFVRTALPEFNYPAGADNVHSRYEGKGGFPISSLPMRAAAAVAEGDFNILLTGYLTGESRMMIRRKVADRLRALASFIVWDPDPYLVLTQSGRLVWMVDGYTTSDAHPYSRSVDVPSVGEVNYIRNSVKATVDAYDGDAQLYIFDAADPVIRAYQRLFPKLFLPASRMPADLRAHARYPEILFRAQAEIYRTFHMLDPEAFYNKEDLWDIARNVKGQEGRPQAVAPTYVVATLPGEEQPEFLLLIPFTPRTKDNLIGLMMARCDGEHLGELVFLQLSKQALIFGPMQIEARINQDQNISKDLTLWNQQGSQVLRGQMLVLPIENMFLYVEPIYIQASEARMPQLKKIAIAMGNSLIYADTYEQAIAELSRAPGAPAPVPAVAAAAAPSPPAGTDDSRRIELIRQHLKRYRDLAAQGRWAEAGKELEAVEAQARPR